MVDLIQLNSRVDRSGLIWVWLLLLNFTLTGQNHIRGVLQDDKGNSFVNTTVAINGRFADVTDERGRFKITIPAKLREGQVVFTVDKEGWLIYHPLSGKTSLPSGKFPKSELVKIILLPKGSLKFLTNERIESIIEEAANKITKLSGELEMQRSKPLDVILRDFAQSHGFTLLEVVESVDTWYQSTSQSKDYKTLGLREFYKRNFKSAGESFNKAFDQHELNFDEASKRKNEEIINMYEVAKLSSDSWFLSGDFKSAIKVITRFLDKVKKEDHPYYWYSAHAVRAYTSARYAFRLTEDSAKYYFESSISDLEVSSAYLDRESYPGDFAHINVELGNIYSNILERNFSNEIFGNPFLAGEQYFFKALEAYQFINQKDGVAAVYDNLGSLYSRKMVYSRSDSMYSESLRNSADTFYNLSISIYLEINNKLGLALTKMNKGVHILRASNSCEELKNASSLFSESLKIYLEMSDYTDVKREISRVVINKGGLLVSQLEGKCVRPEHFVVPGTIGFLKMVSPYRTKEADPEGFFKINYILGSIYYLIGNNRATKFYFKKGLSVYNLEKQSYTCNYMKLFILENNLCAWEVYCDVCEDAISFQEKVKQKVVKNFCQSNFINVLDVLDSLQSDALPIDYQLYQMAANFMLGNNKYVIQNLGEFQIRLKESDTESLDKLFLLGLAENLMKTNNINAFKMADGILSLIWGNKMESIESFKKLENSIHYE